MFSGETNYPQSEPTAMGVDQASLDTSEQGRPLPVFWGRKRLGCTFISNAFWIQATNRDEGGMKGGAAGAMGYNYGVQYAAAICAGPVDAIYEVFINGAPVTFAGKAYPIVRGAEDYVELEVYQQAPDIYSKFRFYWGTESQTIDTHPDGVTEHWQPYYLADLAQEWWPQHAAGDSNTLSRVNEYHPAYKGVCYFVARYHQWISQTTCPKIEFVLGRWPNSGTKVGPSDAPDANPVDVVTDCLTNQRYGLGLASTAYDATDFAATKATLNTEGMGVSPFIDRAQAFDQFLLELLGYFDGFYYARPDGALSLGLNRGVPCSAAIEDGVHIEEDCLTELPDIEAAGINTTRTEVRVQFTNSALGWKDDCCAGHSAGTLEMLGTPAAETLDRSWVTRIDVADKMARAAAKHRALPSVSGTINVRKSRLQGLTVGSPFYFNYAHYGLCHLHCRVTSISVSDPFAPVVEIRFEQDHGFLNAEVYDATSSYTPTGKPSYTPPNIVDALLIELPAGPYAPIDKDPRFVPLVSRPDVAEGGMVSGCLFYWLYDAENGLTRNISGNSAGMKFPARCQLLDTVYADDSIIHLRIVSPHDNAQNGAFPQEVATAPDAEDLDWLLIFDGADEILGITTVDQQADGSYLLGVRRGVLDTVAQEITTGTPTCYAIRFSALNAMQLAVRSSLTVGDTVTVKVYSVIGRSAFADTEADPAKEIACTYRRRSERPWKPLGATAAWPSVWSSATETLIITWAEKFRYGEIPNAWDGPVWVIDCRLPGDSFDILSPATGARYVREVAPHATSYSINCTALKNALGGPQTFVVRLFTRETRTGLHSLFYDQKTITFV